MSRPAQTVRAAGAVLFRRTPDGPEVALVHRERYDDWSHAKGKVDPGEHPATTAAREVLEETGFAVELGRRLPSLRYVANGGPKVVDYWAAEVDADAPFVDNDEVDEIRWVSPEHARTLLSYPHDVNPLDTLLASALPDTTVVLLRHGRAGDRRAFSGEDDARPLDADGLQQARELAVVLPAFGPTRVLSAPLLRCTQTVVPLAEALGVEVELAEAVTDSAYESDPWALVDALREAGRDTGRTTVISSQGSTIPASLVTLFTASDLPLPEKMHCRKGSFWVLSFSEGRLVAADYERDAVPVA